MSVSTEIPVEKANVASTSLLAVVKAKDADGEMWKEVAEVMSFSAGGAGFYLERECRVGCLVSLMLQMPSHLRCYDHEKELYRVWGLVQYSQPLVDEDKAGYHIGVAFIGKQAPASFHDNPMQSYRICGMTEDGLWRIDEAKAAFKARKHVRYWKTIDLYLALVDGNRGSVKGERTVTENISMSGAAVISDLDVEVGDRVKFISEAYDFSGLAVVCNRQMGTDDKTRLHLSFIDCTFPVETLNTQN